MEDLGEVETLLLQLGSIPMFRSKLQLLDNMYSFDAASLQRSAEMHVDACNQLCLSPAVPKLLSVLLSHANFMNAKRGPILTVSVGKGTPRLTCFSLFLLLISGLQNVFIIELSRLQVLHVFPLHFIAD